jgi:predicted ATP-dependent endonuclease of OLD family
MLLIDEPEVALHPNGIRAASQYLYELAKDISWQVMLTTHSPLFINPFEDNTNALSG